jgi:hypothetical protein
VWVAAVSRPTPVPPTVAVDPDPSPQIVVLAALVKRL